MIIITQHQSPHTAACFSPSSLQAPAFPTVLSHLPDTFKAILTLLYQTHHPLPRQSALVLSFHILSPVSHHPMASSPRGSDSGLLSVMHSQLTDDRPVYVGGRIVRFRPFYLYPYLITARRPSQSLPRLLYIFQPILFLSSLGPVFSLASMGEATKDYE